MTVNPTDSPSPMMPKKPSVPATSKPSDTAMAMTPAATAVFSTQAQTAAMGSGDDGCGMQDDSNTS